VNAAGISNEQATRYPHAEPGERESEGVSPEDAERGPDRELAPAPACIICGEEGTAAEHGHSIEVDSGPP
jgi:hypothetical protein